MTKVHPLYDQLREKANNMPYFHCVMFKPLPGTTELQIGRMIEDFNALYTACGGKEAGIISACAVSNFDTRKGFVVLEVAVFQDVEAFIAWHAHPAHTDFAQRMSALMDVWVIGDANLEEGIPIRLV